MEQEQERVCLSPEASRIIADICIKAILRRRARLETEGTSQQPQEQSKPAS